MVVLKQLLNSNARARTHTHGLPSEYRTEFAVFFMREYYCAMQAEREDKLRMVAIYNARLTERERRRAFVAERGLLNVKAQQARWLSLTRLCA